MHESIKMTLTVSLILDEIVNKLLTKTVEENGQIVTKERVLPFSLKYRLTRNKATLDKDYKAYQQKQLMYMAKYGELTADGEHFEIKDPEKLELYKNQMEAALGTIVEHTVIKLDPKDLENLVDDTDLNLPTHIMKLLLGYLVEDTAFLEDIASEIHWNSYTPQPSPADTAAALAQVSEEVSAEQPVEQPVKKTAKKSGTAKKSSPKTTAKKTTAKKTTAKE